MSDHTKDADALLEKLIYCDLRTSVGIDKAKKNIRMALLQQDKKTRHAVAEKVRKCLVVWRCVSCHHELIESPKKQNCLPEVRN